MSFLFDLTASQASLNVKFHGGGEYCKKIFYKLCQTEFNFKCVYNSLKYIDTDIIKKCKEKGITLFDLKEQSLEDIVKKQNIKFIYSALPEGILPWPNCTILGTIHGLRALEMKFDFKSHYLFDNGIIGLNSFLGLLKRKKNLKKTFQHYQKLLNTNNFFFATDSIHSKNAMEIFFPELKTKEIPIFYPPPNYK